MITAVGVEDQASLAALRGLGFTAAQGNHLAKVGNLDEFLPSRVNEVRGLLGLELLSADGLNALFRTEAPSPKQAELETLEVVEDNADEDVVDRLSERVAQEAEPQSKETSTDASPSEEEAAGEEDARKAKAREKAKALVLAKRAKARQARKAAAIARAKAKAAQSKDSEQDVITEAATGTDGQPISAPHELQKRLNQEFAGGGDLQPRAQSGDAIPPETPAPAVSEEQKGATSSSAKSKLTVPERVAAVSAPAQPAKSKAASTPEQKTETPAPPGQASQLKLPIGEVHAYFQPGIVVGGPAMDPRLETSATRAEKQLNDALRATVASAPETPAATPAQHIDLDTEQTPPTSEAAPVRGDSAEPELVATPSSSSTVSAESEQGPVFGDVFNETQDDDDEESC